MSSRYEHGTADRLEYEQARSTVEAARASIASYERAVAQDRNALELLTGGEVDETLLPQTLELKATLAAALPPGTPSEILVHRPDIQRAERQILSANAQIGAARAAFFPSVTLSAGAGTTAMTLSDLFDGGSGMWTFVPNINLPIFSGGRNVANLKSAEVAQKIAVSDYEAAIQTAFREVADALATEDTIVSEVNARTRYADSTRAAFVISEESYKAGTVSYTDVLTQQRAMVAAQQTLITAQLSMASSAVTLWKALGGGTELDESTEVATKGSEG